MEYHTTMVEIEMISLLICDVLPCNYSEQGIWLTLNDEEIVMLDDIFGIVTFIHPRAVQNLLKNPAMLRKFIFIREKAKMRSSWVGKRHHLYYIWHFFGF